MVFTSPNASRGEPDRTRTGSVALSTKRVRGPLVEIVEALCCARRRCATLRCAVLFCVILLRSMQVRPFFSEGATRPMAPRHPARSCGEVCFSATQKCQNDYRRLESRAEHLEGPRHVAKHSGVCFGRKAMKSNEKQWTIFGNELKIDKNE